MFIKSISAICAAALAVVGSPVQAGGSMLSSWYGGYFHGRTTANGETYNMYGHTAASKTLPFGTRLEVCYDGCVTVRINDRGPFIGARELDLSYGAANAIGLTDVGVDYVSFTYI
jgi:rare lipoprotein A